MSEMSSRERLMTTIVGAAIFLLVSYLVVDYFLKNQARLRGELARNTNALAVMRRQMADKPMWDQRETWLLGKQPKLASEDTAGVQLLDRVKDLAKKNAVQISSQSLRPPAWQ